MKHKFVYCGAAVVSALALSLTLLHAQQGSSISLGRLSTGATVNFVKASSGEWGIDIAGPGTPHISQPQPARFEVYTGSTPGPGSKDDLHAAAAGYKSVTLAGGTATAKADIAFGTGVTFHVEDHWSLKDPALSVHRHVEVAGNAQGGFDSAVIFSTAPEVTWADLQFMIPSKLYADPTYDGATSTGGTLHYAAKRLSARENALPAPLVAMNFKDGHSVAVFDPTPKGDTTVEEASAQTNNVMIDDKYNFGALGMHENAGAGVEFGYWLPGTTDDFLGGGRGGGGRGAAGVSGAVSSGAAPAALTAAGNLAPPPPVNATPAWRRRYNPMKQGLVQDYNVAFRFGQKETFPETTRNAFRWAWDTLKPPVNYVDLDYVRRTVIDVHSSQVRTVDGRSGVPYLLDARTGEFRVRSDAKRAAMGFCAKNIEVADEFLKEADRDPNSPRSQKLRKQALDLIGTFVRVLPMSPPAGDGFDIFTGQIIPASWSIGQQPLLTINTDLRTLTLAYEREKKKGIDHPEWLRWITEYADWEFTQQHADGSFPRAWKPGTSEVFNNSPSATYAPIVLYVPLARVTGQKKYMDSAIRAGDFLWANYGAKGNYQGGAVDASSSQLLTDKEAGMASLDAFMALYDATKQQKWLTYALSAADFAESWIYIWNVPLPGNVPDKEMRWRNGSMVGVQGITANGAGIGAGGDEYLDWAVTLYAKAYEYSKDPHYLEVTKILLHNTKAKMATPKDTFDFVGPGWEQEGWNADHGKWLTWMGANHLNGIYTLEEFDPKLYRQLATKPN
jgi:hypothetical protein